MKVLMWPAIKLMSNLSYAAKFGLISVLFMVPMIVLSAQVFLAAFDSLGKTQQELEGLHTAEELYHFAHQLENYRDIAAVVPFQADHALTQEEQRLKQQLTQAFQTLSQQVADVDTQENLQHWSNEFFPRLQTTGEQRQPTFNDQVRYYQMAIDEFYVLINQYNQKVGLALDADGYIQRLISMLNLLPNLNKATGIVHGAGVYAFIEQYLQSTTFDMVNGAYDQLIVAESDLQLLRNNANYIKHPELTARVDGVAEVLDHLRNKIDDEIISAPYLTAEWQTFDRDYQEQLEILLAVERSVLPLIEERLEERYQHQFSRIVVLAFVLIAALSVILYLYLAFFVSIRHTIQKFTDTAGVVARGDLTKQVGFYGKDEMAQLRDAFNSMVSNIRTTLETVKDGTDSVSSNVNDVENIANRSRTAVQEQLEQIEQISRIINEMAEHAGQVANLAEEAEVAAKEGHTKTDDSAQVVSQVMVQIDQLSEEMSHSMEAVNRLAANSDSISSILVTIKNIAEQTNLLALNAAIEAARAGEHGRGFAVVADEVRTLASRSQGSAQEIEGLIKEVQNNIVSTVDTMKTNRTMIAQTVEQSGVVTATLKEVQSSIAAIRSKTAAIVNSATEQQNHALSLENNLQQVRAGGQLTADNAEGTVSEVRKTQQITDALSQRVAQFKV